MPSMPVLLSIVPYLSFYHGGLCSHRLKQLEKVPCVAAIFSGKLEISDRVSRISSDLIIAILKQDKSKLEFLMDITSGRRGVGGGVLVDEIESSLRKFVRIEDIQETYGSPSDDNNSDDAEESEELEPYGPELGKSVETVPCPEEDDPAAPQLLFSEGSTQPIVPLVSAIKGTREKLEGSRRQLTVNWAPDVYDPIPNSVSHAVKSKQKKSRKDKDKDNNNYKKNGKKGQKGYSKGGAGSKDKKQHRKTGGRSEKSYRSCDGLDSSDEFDVGSPDYCGSSFLKKAPSNFHYSVAEAL